MTDTNRSMVVQIQEDANGELFIEFPEDLMERLGWQEGDIIDWEIDDQGRIVARKANISGPIGPT